MRRPSVLTVVLAALLVVSVASIASAAKPTMANATLSSLSASGISGSASFKLDQTTGFAKVHESISGLTPGVTYSSRVYLNSSACTAGINVVTTLVQTFTANGSGKANFNAVVPPAAVPLFDGGASISVEQGTSVLSCGQIVTL